MSKKPSIMDKPIIPLLVISYIFRLILALLLGGAIINTVHSNDNRASLFLLWILLLKKIEEGVFRHLKTAMDRKRYPDEE